MNKFDVGELVRIAGRSDEIYSWYRVKNFKYSFGVYFYLLEGKVGWINENYLKGQGE